MSGYPQLQVVDNCIVIFFFVIDLKLPSDTVEVAGSNLKKIIYILISIS